MPIRNVLPARVAVVRQSDENHFFSFFFFFFFFLNVGRYPGEARNKPRELLRLAPASSCGETRAGTGGGITEDEITAIGFYFDAAESWQHAGKDRRCGV